MLMKLSTYLCLMNIPLDKIENIKVVSPFKVWKYHMLQNKPNKSNCIHEKLRADSTHGVPVTIQSRIYPKIWRLKRTEL